jgi:hypothetical protein
MVKQYRDRGSDTPDAPTRVVKIDTAANRARIEEAEQVAIFEIDDVVYSMAKVVDASVGLNYLQILRNRGVDEATAFLVEKTLGKKALNALRGVEGLKESELESIMKSIRKYALPKERGRKGAA